MRFETKREREQRRKRQKRSAILGMVFAMLVVVGLGVLLWNGKKNIEAKNVEYEKQIKELQEQGKILYTELTDEARAEIKKAMVAATEPKVEEMCGKEILETFRN